MNEPLPHLVVLDASAILAFLLGEAGADTVEDALIQGACCSAVNWSEVAQKVISVGRDWTLARALLLGYGLAIETVTATDGEWAAARYRAGEGLSIADRLCLALSHRLNLTALTGDRAWGTTGLVRQIR